MTWQIQPALIAECRYVIVWLLMKCFTKVTLMFSDRDATFWVRELQLGSDANNARLMDSL